MMKLPMKTPHATVRNCMNEMSAEAIIMKSYYANAMKWEKEHMKGREEVREDE